MNKEEFEKIFACGRRNKYCAKKNLQKFIESGEYATKFELNGANAASAQSNIKHQIKVFNYDDLVCVCRRNGEVYLFRKDM